MEFSACYLSSHWFQLLECRQDKDGRLPHTRLGLAQHIHAQDGLWNALMLNWKRTHKESPITHFWLVLILGEATYLKKKKKKTLIYYITPHATHLRTDARNRSPRWPWGAQALAGSPWTLRSGWKRRSLSVLLSSRPRCCRLQRALRPRHLLSHPPHPPRSLRARCPRRSQSFWVGNKNKQISTEQNQVVPGIPLS